MARQLLATTKRKVHTFLNDPMGASNNQIQSLVKTWGRTKLDRCGALAALAVFNSGRPFNAFAPDYADLWFLYRMVRKRKPRIILEFGAGCSTVVLAKALYDNQKTTGCNGRLYSVDADLFWAKSTATSLPNFLQTFCEISYSPLLECYHEGRAVFRHARIPDVVPNFVYLDGPSLTSERQVAVDLLDMEHQFPADFYLVIDDRKQNTTFLRQHFKRRYNFKPRKFFANPVFTLTDYEFAECQALAETN
jgi:hypothetical protein